MYLGVVGIRVRMGIYSVKSCQNRKIAPCHNYLSLIPSYVS